MSKSLNNVRRLTIAMLAASLVACGTVQGDAPGRAGTQREEPRSDVHLTDFDANDTRTAPSQFGGGTSGDIGSGPALVP